MEAIKNCAAADDGDGEFTVSVSENILFLEKDEMLEILRGLAAEGSEVSPESVEAPLARLTKILDKYQEQSNLLDPHLEEMMAIVTTRARTLLVAKLPTRDALDSAAFPFQVCQDPQLQSLCAVVYQLCRCRGQKCIAKLFPPEAADLEPVLHALQSQARALRVRCVCCV